MKKHIETLRGVKIHLNTDFGTFFANIDGENIKSNNLQAIKDIINETKDSEVNIPIVFASISGNFEEVIVKKVTGYGLEHESRKTGFGVPQFIDYDDAFPLNKKNKEILKVHKKLREAGWALIHNADNMRDKLEPFPKNYFKDIYKKGKIASMKRKVRQLAQSNKEVKG